MMDVTPVKRASIVTLRNANLSVRQIAKNLNLAKSTVGRILKRADDTGDCGTLRQGRCGRKRKTTPHDDKVIIRCSVNDPKKTSKDLQRDLASAGIIVDSSTIRRRLLEAGRIARKPGKKKLLTFAMKEKRLQWALDHKGWTTDEWRKVIFSDVTHFEVHGYRSSLEPLQDGHIQQAPKHPPKMFWGSFTAKGLGLLVIVEGTMNSDKYKAILATHLLPIVARDFPDGEGIFQQDLAPCHTSRKMLTFFEKSGLSILNWPGNSPDLNPIENLWAMTKCRVAEQDCSTVEKLIDTVIRTWYHDEELAKMCSTLVDSMPKRIAMLIKAKGSHISY
ncbi:transposable element Tc1 transposase [Cherax quadricarinatus]|uniref:transposable element Tc1 transposase n=1 Tax=Cherax quadricarinatus TaxID=27406 RepID=UPI00387E22FC